MVFLKGLVLLVNNALGFYLTLIFARVIVSLLINFGILNPNNTVVNIVDKFTGAIVDPVLNLLKKYLPFLVIGSIDISPIVLYLLVEVVQLGLISLVV
jgi:YggT family protein